MVDIPFRAFVGKLRTMVYSAGHPGRKVTETDLYMDCLGSTKIGRGVHVADASARVTTMHKKYDSTHPNVMNHILGKLV